MSTFLSRLVVIGFFLLSLLGPLKGWAGDDDTPYADVRLLSEKTAVGDHTEILLGLDVRLAEGWHTYWRSPGETGEPPLIDWSGSTNVKEATLLFPAPKRLSESTGEVIGYENHVIFPIRAVLQNKGQKTEIKTSVMLLLCGTLCVPHNYELRFALPEGPATDTTDASFLRLALKTIPVAAESEGIRFMPPETTEKNLVLNVKSETPFNEPDLFVETPHDFLFGKPAVSFSEDKRQATFSFPLISEPSTEHPLATSPLTLTLVDGEKAVEEKIVTSPSSPSATPSSKPFSIINLCMALLLGLLGGLILNLMPCVLPVLSLKLMSVIRHGGGDRTAIRHSFLSTAAGIVCSFLLLAGGTIALKTLGATIGWGIQFQQPYFLTFMILVLTLFAASLWGFFEFTLPRWMMDRLDTSRHPQLAGSFATGFLATLLATPCTAPFLGTAVGFALAAGVLEIVAVFAALGIGMASPYLLVAYRPALVSRLPRSGPWMLTLSRLLGWGMAGTAIWLLIVLQAQIGQMATALVTAGMAVILILGFLRHRGRLRPFFLPLTLLVMAGSFFLVHLSTIPTALAPQSGRWQRFDELALHQAVEDGKIVFIDITADWCLNCKFNKRFILSGDEITRRLFEDERVVAMQGDWTNPDPAITAFLHKYGRYGIPFNAVFGPKAPEGILLPEILSTQKVMDALDRAASPACTKPLPGDKSC